MNIQEAKRQIKRAVSIYLMKDEFGAYRIPVVKQRPIFLVGAPGIGKTAIMEQIAEELGISLVSYSMTHHTRQSALGLPFIVHKEFRGQNYDVTEYTMSEIIATVYDTIEKSGNPEGILFLDEINCVSETLGPSMLQFLQYKTFGNAAVPEGWVIVTAGNPTEYNRSAREFDVATLDRLKVMEVEPDYEAWKYYAGRAGVHQAVLTFLDIRKEDFYSVEKDSEEKKYVTARGWEDLSETLKLYEEKEYPVDETLISQYIRAPRIAREFTTYYALYRKYRSDYRIPEILAGQEPPEIRKRAAEADFDERLTLTGLLIEAVMPRIRKNVSDEEALKRLLPYLKELKNAAAAPHADVHALLDSLKDRITGALAGKQAGGNAAAGDLYCSRYAVSFIRKCWDRLELSGSDQEGGMAAFAEVKAEYDGRVQAMQAEVPGISDALENIFRFVEHVFGDENEMLVLVTELTVSRASARFLAEHGCAGYYRHNKRLMVFERNRELMEEIEKLDEAGQQHG